MDVPANQVDGQLPQALQKLAAVLAVIGGILTCLAACLVTVSVVGRWLFNSPMPADYELVEIAVGVAVFAFLGYTQARSGHIMVDTFTASLPARLNARIDGVWDLLLGCFLAFFAWGLFSGGLEARSFGMTLVQLPWPVWPVYMACALLAGLASVIAFVLAAVKIAGRRP
ncbi:TRAP transporter small permease [Mesorhizobium sp. CN2-181]|uniref:TRAP transporter small permease n=1 Tax=Mesorhizobium yinganensis TaxID=3157707 RepID=UPI0032B78027